MMDSFLSETFKQAIQEGMVSYRDFSICHISGRYDVVTGWCTETFGVADNITSCESSPDKHSQLFYGHYSEFGYVITHLESGQAIFSFETHHVALNFMLELDRFLGSRDIYSADIQKEVIHFLRTRGLHECQTYISKTYHQEKRRF